MTFSIRKIKLSNSVLTAWQPKAMGQMDKAKLLFLQAWNESDTDFEKFTAAHFVARHQDDTVSEN